MMARWFSELLEARFIRAPAACGARHQHID